MSSAEKTILVVESQSQDVVYLAAHLKERGFLVVVAPSCEKAFQRFVEELPDMVLISLIMPDGPGTDLVKRIRGRHDGVDVPVYLLSPLASSGKRLVDKSGATGQVAKPIVAAELDRVLSEHFGPIKIRPAKSTERTARGASRPVPSAGRRAEKKRGGSDWRDTDLAEMPLPKILAQALKHRATGILTIVDAVRTVEIRFLKGHPVDFSAGAFAEFLARNGRLSAAEARKVRDLAEQNQYNAQEAVGRLGVLDGPEIAILYMAFAYELVQNLSGRKQGEVQFKEADVAGVLPINTVDLVVQGVQTHYDLDKLREIFDKDGRDTKPLYLKIDPASLFNVSPPVSTIAAAVEEGKTLEELTQDQPASTLFTHQVVYALLLCGVLTYSENERVIAAAKPAPAEPVEAVEPPAAVPESAPVRTIESPTSDEEPETEEPVPPPVQAPEPEQDDLWMELEEPEAPSETIEAEPLAEPEPTTAPSFEPTIPVKPERPPMAKTHKESVMAEAPEEEEEEGEDEDQEREVVHLDDDEILRAASEFLENGTFSKAQACLEELIERGVRNPKILVDLAWATYNNRFFANPKDRLLEAAWVIKEALAVDGKHLDAYVTFGKILEKDGKPELAEDQYRAALAIDPKQPQARAAVKRLTTR